jgi:CheY-like chemotaxis protein
MSGLHAAVGRRGRVMVIDDEPFIAEAISLFLGDENEITAFHNANDALTRLAEGDTFDVILSDILMPEMTGLEFHQRLVAAHPEHAPRVVFITGGVYRSADRDYLDSIPNTCIDKPPDPFKLRALVRERVSERTAARVDKRRSA